MRSLFSLNIHIIYSEFISQSSNYTVGDNPKSLFQYKYAEFISNLGVPQFHWDLCCKGVDKILRFRWNL